MGAHGSAKPHGVAENCFGLGRLFYKLVLLVILLLENTVGIFLCIQRIALTLNPSSSIYKFYDLECASSFLCTTHFSVNWGSL